MITADNEGGSQDAARLFSAGELLAGRFRIAREIARGGMGVVYEAHDEKLDRRIAIKAAQSDHAWLLSPEVRNASTVSHPNICRIFELHSAHTAAGDVEFVTMEYLEGETLAQRLRRGPLPDAETRAIGSQLCAGLAEAHRGGIIHGDLKPQNIMLSRTADGAVRAVIMDFGLAQGPRQQGSSGGTPGYMAPELLTGGPTSVASDIYSLGVILHELVAGLRPRERAAELALTVTASASAAPTISVRPREHWTQPAPRPLGSRWDPVLKRCLAEDPAARFADVSQLQRAIDPPRGRRVAVTVALVVVALSLGFAYWRVNAPASTVALTVQSSLDLEGALDALRGTRTLGYRVTRGVSGATHVVHVSGFGSGDSSVSIEVVDMRTRAKLAEWQGTFAPDDRPYAPAAVAGMVSAALHLTPPRTFLHDAEAQRLYERALPMLRHDEQIDSARVLMQLAADHEPASPLPWAGAAEAEWRQFYLTGADAWLARCRESVRRAELRGMDSPEVHRIAGLLEANDGRFAQAITRYERATELPATNSDAWRRLGEAYRRSNQPDLSLGALRRAVEVEPDYYRTHQDLGQWFFARGDYQASIPELQTAAQLAPTVVRVRSVLASALMNTGRFGAAEQELRTALEQQDDARVRLSLGQVLMYQSRDREAIPELRRSAGLDGSQFLAQLYLGDCLRSTGRVAESRAAYARGFALAEREVERAPQSGYNRGFLAYLCARRGDVHRAGAEIAQALKASPDMADVMWAAALTYETIGHRDAALSALSTAPRDLLEDLSRWPQAAGLAADERFQHLLHAAQRAP